MKYSLKTALYMMSIFFIFQACESETVEPEDEITPLTTPPTYEFASRFVDGVSSVSYTGQVVRNVIIKDLKSLASNGTLASDSSALTDLFNNGGASTATMLNQGLQTQWSDFGNTSKLSNKIATDVLLGYGHTPTDQMMVWFSEVPALMSFSDGGSTRMIRADSLELNQMIGKGLLGVVAYYQGTSVYMPKIDNDDNTMQDDGDPYTAMEHHWDESFGYFGAAIDYNTYEGGDDARKSSFDSNEDGFIDYKTEYNFGWATYAAKRDIDCAATCTVDNDFTGTIMGAYLEGRTLIYNESPLADIQAQRTIIVNAWEKLVVSNIIHYAKSVSDKIEAGNVSILHAWAEMRAFAMALQYNQYKVIGDTALSEVITMMGTVPPALDSWTTYKETLTGTNGIVSKLQTAYSLDQNCVDSW